jgi:hypothetical protein
VAPSISSIVSELRLGIIERRLKSNNRGGSHRLRPHLWRHRLIMKDKIMAVLIGDAEINLSKLRIQGIPIPKEEG